jgi:hypothetical protein
VVYEVFYRTEQGNEPKASNPNPIWYDRDKAGIIAIAGFYSDDDKYRHLLVATKDGNVHELFYQPDRGPAESVIASFPGIVDIAGFYNADDHYRAALVGLSDGKLWEVYFQPYPKAGHTPHGQSVIYDFGNDPVRSVAGTYMRATGYRRAVVLTQKGRMIQVLYHPTRNKQEGRAAI